GAAYSGCGPAFQRVPPAESRLRPGLAAPQVTCQLFRQLPIRGRPRPPDGTARLAPESWRARRRSRTRSFSMAESVAWGMPLRNDAYRLTHRYVDALSRWPKRLHPLLP